MESSSIELFELLLTYCDKRNYNMVKRFAYQIANKKNIQDASTFMLFFVKPDLLAQGIVIDV